MKKTLFILLTFLALAAVCVVTGCSGNGKTKGADQKGKTEKNVSLEAPDADSFEFTLDGSYVYVSFDAVENATSYEWEYEGSILELSEPSGNFRNVQEGERYSSSFRAVNNSGSETVYSEWTEVSYKVPELDNSRCPLEEGVFLTESKLESVAKAQGYDIEKTTEGDEVIVLAYKKDPNNTGILKGVGRVFTGNVTSIGKSITANQIVYQFTYSDVKAGADLCVKTELASNNESDANSYNNCKTDKLGRYICDITFGTYYAEVDTVTEGGLEEYVFTYSKE